MTIETAFELGQPTGLAPEMGSAERARYLLAEAIQGEVKKRLDAYLNDEWMILRVPRLAVPDGAQLAECYETEKEFVIVGMPDADDEEHDCDAMGCGTLSHVLHRIKKRNTQGQSVGA
jgi:hypothetical protein